MIHKDVLLEDLVRDLPKSVGYLMEKGIKCIACGEPIWGTLAEAAKEKGFSNRQIDEVVTELNAIASKGEKLRKETDAMF
jgi:methionine synthase II (cobalamin-independent)